MINAATWIIGISASALIAAIIALISYLVQKKRSKKSPSIEDKITSLNNNLKDSLSVISEIESEIKNRSEIVNKLKEDDRRYEEIKELNQSQVEAIAQTIKGELASESRKSLWRNAIITFIVALIFFLLGFWTNSI